MASSLIVFYGNDPLYFGIVWQLAKLSRDAGDTPVLLDVTDVLGGLGDSVNRRALTVFRAPSPDVRFRELLHEGGYELLNGAASLADGMSFPISTEAREGFTETTRSALISFSRDPLPRVSRGMWAALERDFSAAADRVYATVSAVLFARPEIDSVCVLNGRFPYQRAVLEAALAQGRKVMHYEKGEKPNTYWLEDHSTLDREKTQSSVDGTLAHLSDEQARSLGRGWMDRRSARGSANIYSRFFDDSGDDTTPSQKKSSTVVGLFTSSQDEFAALGPEWHVQEWADQWDGFDHVLTHLEPYDYTFYLRVHPNFATKSHASFVRERARLEELRKKHPALRIIWHDEQVNSYALVNDTDVVVVWDSTIGLEASGRGKPVWELAASYYDLYADVRQWFSASDAPSPDSLQYPVDVAKAERFMAYLDLREPELSRESIAVQESVTPAPSAGLRVANLLSSGGAPYARIAVSSILDSIRHRRSSVNAKATKKYFAADRVR
jgi:hypothetical protein